MPLWEIPWPQVINIEGFAWYFQLLLGLVQKGRKKLFPRFIYRYSGRVVQDILRAPFACWQLIRNACIF